MTTRLDLEALLAPVTAEAPAGQDLRAGSAGSELYLQLKDHRATARVAEREASQGEAADADPLRAGLRYWESLAEGAVELLMTAAKDLEVAAWLTEASLRSQGIAGLADGFELLAALIERYWHEGLWPAADEDGDESRLIALFGLFGRGGTGTLLQPLKLIALSDRGGAAVTLAAAEIAAAPPGPRNSDEEIQARVDEKRAAALDALATGIGRSSKPFLLALRADLLRAQAALDALMGIIDRVSDVGRFGSQVNEPLASALRLLNDHAGAVFIDAEVAASPDAAGEPGGQAAPDGRIEPRTLANREDALARILVVAEYFERAEPQSFAGPALRDVVRRARMPLEGLLSELLPDASARTLFLQRAGIRLTPSEVESEY